MEDYIAYSNTYELGTKVVFTTGTVDFEGEWWGEGGYQGHIKHETIRNYVKADPSKILFDYADILCHDDDGTMNTQTWNGHTYPSITSTNELPRNYGHISDAGALKLAKAQWWMLARIAGWNSGSSAVNEPDEDVDSLHVVASNDSLIITISDYHISSTVRVFDVQGSLLAVKQLNSSSGSINISNLPSGIYFVVLSGGDSLLTREVVI